VKTVADFTFPFRGLITISLADFSVVAYSTVNHLPKYFPRSAWIRITQIADLHPWLQLIG